MTVFRGAGEDFAVRNNHPSYDAKVCCAVGVARMETRSHNENHRGNYAKFSEKAVDEDGRLFCGVDVVECGVDADAVAGVERLWAV